MSASRVPSTTADVTATVVQLMHQVERQPRHQVAVERRRTTHHAWAS